MVALAFLVLAFILIAPQRAEAIDCQTAICVSLPERTTDAKGKYTLFIPADYVGTQYPDLNGCTWQVNAQFGDGSEPEEYEFHEESNFGASHAFPEAGHYQVVIDATEGERSDHSECPDVHIEVPVTYPVPPPPKEEESAPESPGVQPPGGGGGGGAAAAATQQPAGAAPQPQPRPPYWHACGGGVRAHLVACGKAKRVIRAARALLARARLEQGATFRVAGFSCRLRGNGDVACRRGKQRVLGA